MHCLERMLKIVALLYGSQRKMSIGRGILFIASRKHSSHLLKCAYKALYTQNDFFREALLSTKGKHLYHIGRKTDSYKTILTEKEFCLILMDIREGGN